MLRLAFEPFANLDLTKPFKLIPLGTWYREDRKLVITEGRLREIEKHSAEGMPNFRVPINLDHVDSNGKVGEIKKVQFIDGPNGPGLYVTEYELTEAGQKAIEERGYDAVSAEVYWSLNGSAYQDPRDGQSYDNVLVGVALTPYPYFGHTEVALYSQHMMPEAALRPFGGALTFDEYDAWMDSEMELRAAQETERVFRGLLDNLQAADLTGPEKAAAIRELADQFAERVQGYEEAESGNS